MCYSICPSLDYANADAVKIANARKNERPALRDDFPEELTSLMTECWDEVKGTQLLG